MARHLAGGDDATQVAFDQGDLGGVDGDIAAGPHGDTDVGLRQGGSIVDAVPSHGHHVALTLQLLDKGQFVVRFDPTVERVDAQGGCDFACGSFSVAGGHHDRHPIGVKGLDSVQAWSP